MGNLFSADNSVALLLPQALESGGDAVAYPWLAPLPDALGEVEGYAKTSDAHQAAMRASMQAPGDGALLGAALAALAPGVRAVVRWGDLADGVAAKLPPLVGAFAAEAKALVAKKALVEGGAPPAATAALLELLEFLLAFDGAKLVTPCIQNEFAFIKRAAQKDPGATAAILDSNRAPAVSMFIAQASPMLAAAAGASSSSPLAAAIMRRSSSSASLRAFSMALCVSRTISTSDLSATRSSMSSESSALPSTKAQKSSP